MHVVCQHRVQVVGGIIPLLHALGNKQSYRLVKFHQFTELGRNGGPKELLRLRWECFLPEVHGWRMISFRFLVQGKERLLLLQRSGGREVVHCMTGCYLRFGKGFPFLRYANRFATKSRWPNRSFLLVGIPMGLWVCVCSGRCAMCRGFPPVHKLNVVVLSGFHFFTVGEAMPKQLDRPLRGRRKLIINLDNANVDRGVEKDHNSLFIVNSL